MATKAQIDANRKNAQKSTGPCTQEGKETVSQNATKHGLCSCKNVIRSESQDEYNLFRNEMIADLSPVGAMEEMLAERIVSLSWRLKRAEIYQNSVIDSIIDDRLHERWDENRRAQEQAKEGDMSLILGLAIRRDFANSKILEQLLSYEKRIESSLYKATAELRKMKKIRREREMMEDGRGTIDEERKTINEGGEMMDEKDFVIHPTSSCELRRTRSQSKKEYRTQDTEYRMKSDSLGITSKQTIDEGRRTIDERGGVMYESDFVKHPASSPGDYAVKQSQMCS